MDRSAARVYIQLNTASSRNRLPQILDVLKAVSGPFVFTYTFRSLQYLSIEAELWPSFRRVVVTARSSLYGVKSRCS